jgi:RNA polymerase sigma-70 factor (ECF subfamily)
VIARSAETPLISRTMTIDPTINPDYSLVVRFRSGDPLAFEALVEKYKQSIVNLAARILQDVHEAYDIAQKVFMKAYRALGTFEFACNLSTWFYKVTRNLCVNELRRRSRHRCSSLDEPWKDSAVREVEDTRSRSPFQIVSHAELIDRMEQALAALPETQRTAILLCRDRQMSYEQIAEILQISIPATKSLIHRGRSALKHQLSPYLSGRACPEWRSRSPRCLRHLEACKYDPPPAYDYKWSGD